MFLESDDFEHDVRLEIYGDFATGDRLRYAKQLARWLNHNLPPRCQCKDPRQCWEPCGELGNSEEHCRRVSEEEEKDLESALRQSVKFLD